MGTSPGGFYMCPTSVTLGEKEWFTRRMSHAEGKNSRGPEGELRPLENRVKDVGRLMPRIWPDGKLMLALLRMLPRHVQRNPVPQAQPSLRSPSLSEKPVSHPSELEQRALEPCSPLQVWRRYASHEE